MRNRLLVLLALAAAPAFASGGVICTGKGGLELSWGAGHTTGYGRISPYQLRAFGDSLEIVDKGDSAALKSQVPKGARLVEARQVGYWNGKDILVHIADEQVSTSLLTLEVRRQKKGEPLKGTLTLAPPLVKKAAEVDVTCTVE